MGAVCSSGVGIIMEYHSHTYLSLSLSLSPLEAGFQTWVVIS